MAAPTRLEASVRGMHGIRGHADWLAPRLVAKSAKTNRPDQDSTISANEYLDEPDVLAKKVEILAELIKKSTYTCAYTGAGLSKVS